MTSANPTDPISPPELLAALNELLDAERAGARRSEEHTSELQSH